MLSTVHIHAISCGEDLHEDHIIAHTPRSIVIFIRSQNIPFNMNTLATNVKEIN